MWETKAVVFYLFIGGFLIGVTGALLLPLSLPYTLWLLVMSCALAVLWRRGGQERRKKPLLFSALLLLSLALGVGRVEVAKQYAPPLLPFGHATFEGVVVRDPDVRETTTHLYLKSQITTLLIVTRHESAVRYGDTLRVTGDVSLPEPFLTEFGRTFRYDGYLKAKGVAQVVYFPTEIAVLSERAGHPLLSFLFTIKHSFTEGLSRVLSKEDAALASGLLLGEKRALGEVYESLFRKAGVIHIVVLSGYNVMLVVAFFMFLVSFFMHGKQKLVVGLVAIVAFALIVGLGATVVRAALMASMVLIADALGRRYAVWRALCLAAVLMVLVHPYVLVFDPGFQLSFLATAGLISVVPYFEARMATGVLPLKLRELFLTTLAAQLAVLPMLLYQIGEFSLVALLANMLILPAVPVAMLLSFLAGVLALLLLPLGQIVALPASLVLSYIYFVTEFLGGLAYAAVAVPPFPFFVVMIVYFGYGVVFWKLKKVKSGAPVVSKDTTGAPPIFFR